MVENTERDEEPKIKGIHREKLAFSDAVVNNYHRRELYVEEGATTCNLRQDIISLEDFLKLILICIRTERINSVLGLVSQKKKFKRI